jgi:hypothetical protein
MIKKINPKKSIPTKIKIMETAKKIDIKNRTELIGLTTEIIKIAEDMINVYNKIKKRFNII